MLAPVLTSCYSICYYSPTSCHGSGLARGLAAAMAFLASSNTSSASTQRCSSPRERQTMFQRACQGRRLKCGGAWNGWRKWLDIEKKNKLVFYWFLWASIYVVLMALTIMSDLRSKERKWNTMNMVPSENRGPKILVNPHFQNDHLGTKYPCGHSYIHTSYAKPNAIGPPLHQLWLGASINH